MRKDELWSWIIGFFLSLIFLSNAFVWLYWLDMRAMWWRWDFATLTLFLQGAGYFYYGLSLSRNGEAMTKANILFEVQSFLHMVANKLLNPFGLIVTWTDYYIILDELSSQALELERRAIVDRLHLATLLAEKAGWSVEWVEGGDTFTVIMSSEEKAEYPQELDHIDKVLEDLAFCQSLDRIEGVIAEKKSSQREVQS